MGSCSPSPVTPSLGNNLSLFSSSAPSAPGMPQWDHPELLFARLSNPNSPSFSSIPPIIPEIKSSGFAPTAPRPSCAGSQTWMQNSRWDLPGAEEKGCENLNKTIPFPGTWNSVPIKPLLIPAPLHYPNSQNFMGQEPVPLSKSLPRASQPRLRVLGMSPEGAEFLQFFSRAGVPPHPPVPLFLIPILGFVAADVTHPTPFSFCNLGATFFNQVLNFQPFPVFF